MCSDEKFLKSSCCFYFNSINYIRLWCNLTKFSKEYLPIKFLAACNIFDQVVFKQRKLFDDIDHVEDKILDFFRQRDPLIVFDDIHHAEY